MSMCDKHGTGTGLPQACFKVAHHWRYAGRLICLLLVSVLAPQWIPLYASRLDWSVFQGRLLVCLQPSALGLHRLMLAILCGLGLFSRSDGLAFKLRFAWRRGEGSTSPLPWWNLWY
jgi:hypothetical protein